MKKIFIVSTLVAVGIGALIWTRNTPTAKNPEKVIPDRSQIGEISVIYTDSGYNPKEVRVKAGETIRFINESGNLMWTASDPHPTHTMMHPFDSLKGMSNGQTYSFTFTESIRYHNHLVPGHMGSVIIVE